MQVKLSVLKEEKRLLLLKLKQKELSMRHNGEDAAEDFGHGDDSDLEDATTSEWEEASPEPFFRGKKRSRSESPFARPFTSDPPLKRSASTLHIDDLTASPSQVRVRSELNIFTRNCKPVRTMTVHLLPATKPEDMVKAEKKAIRPLTRTVSTLTVPVEVCHQGTIAGPIECVERAHSPLVPADQIVTRDTLARAVQDAVFRTEEEIFGCPLLQRAMAKVEQETLGGDRTDIRHTACQAELDPMTQCFTSVGVQCHLEGDDMACPQCQSSKQQPEAGFVGLTVARIAPVPSLGKPVRDIGICTEKWVDIIKASKQTDTDDFPFKDTASPTVAEATVAQQGKTKKKTEKLKFILKNYNTWNKLLCGILF